MSVLDKVEEFSGQSEINIVLKDLEKDERVNVIGHLNTTDFIISKIIDGKRFTFVNKYE